MVLVISEVRFGKKRGRGGVLALSIYIASVRIYVGRREWLGWLKRFVRECSLTGLRALWNALHLSVHAALQETTSQVSLWCRFRFRLRSLVLAFHSYCFCHPSHTSLLPPLIPVCAFLLPRVPPFVGGTAESLPPTRTYACRTHSVFDVFLGRKGCRVRGI